MEIDCAPIIGGAQYIPYRPFANTSTTSHSTSPQKTTQLPRRLAAAKLNRPLGGYLLSIVVAPIGYLLKFSEISEFMAVF